MPDDCRLSITGEGAILPPFFYTFQTLIIQSRVSVAVCLSRFLRLSLFVALILAASRPSMTGPVDGSISGTRYEHGALILVILVGTQGIGPMACLTVETTRGEIKVSPRWQGKNLAVHSTVIEDRNDGIPFGQATKNDGVYWHWTITHRPTGFIAARFTESNLKVAMLIAKQFDGLFNHKDQEAVTADTEFVNEWKSVVAKYFGKVG